jgi:lipoprotein-anchoring transpeptidase ErfK/SrfK
MRGSAKQKIRSLRDRGRNAWEKLVAHRKRLLVAGLLILFVMLGTATAAAYAYDQAESDKILPGVHVAGVDLSGFTRDEARLALRKKAHKLLNRKIAIHAAGRTWRTTPRKLGVRADFWDAVDYAFNVSDSIPWVSRVYHRLAGWSVDKNLRLPMTISKTRVKRFVAHLASKIDRPALNAMLALDGTRLVKQHAAKGRKVILGPSFHRLLHALKTGGSQVWLRVVRNAPKISDGELGKTLTVDLTTLSLRLWDRFKVVRSYPVATAQPGFVTPIGRWSVVDKVMWPSWTNPDPTGWGAGMPLYIPPGPDNPLGTRALYLSAPGIRIHGTPEDSSIGTYASHGCIRMHISDSEALYPLVKVGTPVVIYGAPPWGNPTSGGPAG